MRRASGDKASTFFYYNNRASHKEKIRGIKCAIENQSRSRITIGSSKKRRKETLVVFLSKFSSFRLSRSDRPLQCRKKKRSCPDSGKQSRNGVGAPHFCRRSSGYFECVQRSQVKLNVMLSLLKYRYFKNWLCCTKSPRMIMMEAEKKEVCVTVIFGTERKRPDSHD